MNASGVVQGKKRDYGVHDSALTILDSGTRPPEKFQRTEHQGSTSSSSTDLWTNHDQGSSVTSLLSNHIAVVAPSVATQTTENLGDPNLVVSLIPDPVTPGKPSGSDSLVTDLGRGVVRSGPHGDQQEASPPSGSIKGGRAASLLSTTHLSSGAASVDYSKLVMADNASHYLHVQGKDIQERDTVCRADNGALVHDNSLSHAFASENVRNVSEADDQRGFDEFFSSGPQLCHVQHQVQAAMVSIPDTPESFENKRRRLQVSVPSCRITGRPPDV
jgi:hypothetical protein